MVEWKGGVPKAAPQKVSVRLLVGYDRMLWFHDISSQRRYHPVYQGHPRPLSTLSTHEKGISVVLANSVVSGRAVSLKHAIVRCSNSRARATTFCVGYIVLGHTANFGLVASMYAHMDLTHDSRF